MFIKIFKKIPYIEAFRAFLEQWGVWSIVASVFPFVGAFAVTALAWADETLHLWAVVLIGITSFAAISAILFFGYGFFLKRKQSKLVDNLVSIDRVELADEVSSLSQEIAQLVGEFREPMALGVWSTDSSSFGENMQKAEARMVERFQSKYAQMMWELVRRATKVIQIDISDLWSVKHGVRGERDITACYIFLAGLADDLRYPMDPIHISDRDEERRKRIRKKSDVSRSPLGK